MKQFVLIDDIEAFVITCKSYLPSLPLVIFQNYVLYNRKDDIKEEAKEGLVPRAWQERKAKEKTAQFYPEYSKMVDFLFQKVLCTLILPNVYKMFVLFLTIQMGRPVKLS